MARWPPPSLPAGRRLEAQERAQVGSLQAVGDLPWFCIQLELQFELWQIHSSSELNKTPSRNVHCIINKPTAGFLTTLTKIISSYTFRFCFPNVSLYPDFTHVEKLPLSGT